MRSFAFALFFVPFLSAWAFTVPPLTGPVVDQAGMLSGETKEGLDGLLRRVRESGGTQLQVLIVPTLDGLSIEEASIKVADAWKLGSAKDDNGVLLLIAAKERRVRIEVGQGREGVLTDLTAGRIIREVIVPQFRSGSADRAVTSGVFAILHYTDPEAAGRAGYQAPSRAARGPDIEMLLFFGFVLIFFILPLLRFQRRHGIRSYGRWGGGNTWGGGSSWGGGGFGGGGGGGWSGGGGGFSGGGASGGW